MVATTKVWLTLSFPKSRNLWPRYRHRQSKMPHHLRFGSCEAAWSVSMHHRGPKRMLSSVAKMSRRNTCIKLG